MKIYEGNSKAWDLLIISLSDINFGLVRQWNEYAHEAWKALIGKYEVSDEKQEILNEVTNRWNNLRMKEKSQDTDIWYTELFNWNLKFKKTNEKNERDGDDLNAHVFDILPEDYKTIERILKFQHIKDGI